MSTPFSENQVSRLAQFRRNRRAVVDSSLSESPPAVSDTISQAPPDFAWRQFPAVTRPGATSLQPPPLSLLEQTPPATNRRSDATVKASLPFGLNSSSVMGSIAAASAATPPAAGKRPASTVPPLPQAAPQPIQDESLAAYILDLERQNAELRHHVQFLQSTLLTQDGEGTSGRDDMISGVERSAAQRAAGPLHNEDRQAFLNDVLAQVEIIVQAHRNRAALEIEKHKRDAEQARNHLQQLRDAIHQEGLDLSLAPASLLIQRKYSESLRHVAVTHDEPSRDETGPHSSTDAVAPSELPPEAKSLLEAVVEEMLNRLASMNEGDDIADTVRRAASANFRAIVDFYATQLVDRVHSFSSEVESLKAGIASAKEQGRSQLAASENQRVLMSERYEAQIQALRDELHAYHLAASKNDDVQATMQERALDEYTAMLVAARQEAAQNRKWLEEERNHAAEVCLKLKSALHKRNLEFEQEVAQKAETIIETKERRISELEAKLKRQRDEQARSDAAAQRKLRKDVGCQSDPFRPAMQAASERSFIPNIVKVAQQAVAGHNSGGLHSSSAPEDKTHLATTTRNISGTPHSSAMNFHLSADLSGIGGLSAIGQQPGNLSYEQQVLRKTQELLSRYGGSTPR